MFNQLREQLRHIKARQKLQSDVWDETSDKKLLTFYSKIMTKALGAERCSIFVTDPGHKSVWLQTSNTLGEKAIEVPVSDSIVGRVIESGQPVIETGLQNKQGRHKEVDAQTGFTTRDILCVPVRSADGTTVTGALQVLNKADGSTFSSEDQDLLEELAKYLQLQIESLFLNQETVTVTEKALNLVTKVFYSALAIILLLIGGVIIYNFTLVGLSGIGN